MKQAVIVAVIAMGLLLGTVAGAADTQKIGVVDSQKVLDQSKAGKRAKGLMDDYLKSRQKVVDLDEQELKRLEEKITVQGAALTLEARRELQQDYQRKLEQYQRRVVELNREVQAKKNEVLREFNKGMEGIVKQIAQKDGYALILDQNGNNGPVLFHQGPMDLTDQVIKAYDKTSP